MSTDRDPLEQADLDMRETGYAEVPADFYDEFDLDGADPPSRHRCPDCGEPGVGLGHMGCQYPGLSEGRQ